jgi:hypothetical protein
MLIVQCFTVINPGPTVLLDTSIPPPGVAGSHPPSQQPTITLGAIFYVFESWTILSKLVLHFGIAAWNVFCHYNAHFILWYQFCHSQRFPFS